MRFAINLVIPVLVMIFLIHQPWICGAEVADTLSTESIDSNKNIPNAGIENLLAEAYDKSGIIMKTMKPSPGTAIKIVSYSIMSFYNADISKSELMNADQEIEKIEEDLNNQTNFVKQRLLKRGYDKYNSINSMRSLLDNLNTFHDENFQCLMGFPCDAEKLGGAANESVDPSSIFRTEFNLFITKYLKEEKSVYGKKAAKNVFGDIIEEISSKVYSSTKCRDVEWMELRFLHRLEEYITLIVAKSYTMILTAQMYFHRLALASKPEDAYHWIAEAIDTAKKFYYHIPFVYISTENLLSRTFNNETLCPKDKYTDGRVLVAADFAQKDWKEKYYSLFTEICSIYEKTHSIVYEKYDI